MELHDATRRQVKLKVLAFRQQMINGLYSGAAALNVLARKQEAISSNLAHLNTGGHRRIEFGTRQISLASNKRRGAAQGYGPEIARQKTDFTQGRTQITGRPLDFALNGDAFFVLQHQGQELLTRNGRFFRSAETGQLVNADGITVSGDAGPIVVDEGISDNEITVTPDGTISANGENIGKLRLVAFANNQDLQAISQTQFRATRNSPTKEVDATVSQNALEMSNASPVSELMALIINSRQYEAVQKATRTLSETIHAHIQA